MGAMRNITIAALCVLLTACVGGPMPEAGQPVCGPSGVPGVLCELPSGEPTDQSMPWLSRPVCGGGLDWVTRWTVGADGSLAFGGRVPEEGGAPAACAEDGSALCADGSAPVCEWWAVPQQDWQETCVALMREQGLTEARCIVPMAPYPETTVDPARIRVE